MRFARAFVALAFLLAACDLPPTATDPAGHVEEALCTNCSNCNYFGAQCCSEVGGCFCEATQGDVNNCGACGYVCGTQHTTAVSCIYGTCFDTCSAGYTNCDGVGTTGCETHTASDVNNCGSCGHVCPSTGANVTGAACTNGVCSLVCSAGYADCNGSATDGCEVHTAVDTSNCGTCGHVCATQGAGTHMTGNNCCSSGLCGDLCGDQTTCEVGAGNCPSGYGQCTAGGVNGCNGLDCWAVYPYTGPPDGQVCTAGAQVDNHCGEGPYHCNTAAGFHCQGAGICN